jgi:hypothetical protein
MAIRALCDWVTLRDYDRAKDRAAEEIEQQISRGNTLAQNGSCLEQPELDKVSMAADRAMVRIERRVTV